MDKTFRFAGYKNSLEKGEVIFCFVLELPEKTLNFSEKLVLPKADFSKVSNELIERVFNSLSLILGISYWKTYCSENIDLGDIKLTAAQADFWNTVYIKGLGEFFYQNKIDFTSFDLFKANSGDSPDPVRIERKNRVILPVGGGKDSIISAELLKKAQVDFSAFTLGESEIQEKIIELLDVDRIVIKREVDPQLFELNKQRVYNGHIPISAIYHFVALLAAVLYDYKYIAFSNEKSANYGNVEYLGKEINHQWSKSFEYEKMFQNYMKDFVTPDIIPFSLLRPMNEIKIVELFSKYPQYFGVFSSCNKNFKIKKEDMNSIWCGECPKCLFVFACLAAFITKDAVVKIFGQNLFEKENLIEKYKELLGVNEHKPFDCVGTPEEVRLAFFLAFKTNEYTQALLMKMFVDLFEKDFGKIAGLKSLLSLSNESSIPQDFISVLNSV